MNCSDEGLETAMAAFDAVGPGMKSAYTAALTQAQRLVRCPVKQLAMVDCILDARARAYGGKS